MSVDKPQSINTMQLWLEFVLVAVFAFDVFTEPIAMDAMAEDNAFIASDDDTLEDRVYWMATACPCKEECSDKSWGRLTKYSYRDEETVRGFIKDHLMSSSLHNLSREDAEYQASIADIEVCTETAGEREAYRAQVKRAQAQSGKGKSKPQVSHVNKRKGGANHLQNEIKRLKDELQSMRGGDDNNSGGSSSAYENVRRPVGATTTTVATVPKAPKLDANLNGQRMQIVKDSIQRAQNSLAQSARMLNASAVAFQERSTACTAAAAQLSEENEVLSAARNLLTELAAELRFREP